MKFSATFVTISLIAVCVQAHKLPSMYALQRRGTQFVTGKCTTDSDCQQGCCAFTTGLCAGPGIAQTNGDGGCGFGNPQPNCNVAAALGLDACVAGAAKPDTTDAGVQTAAAFTAKLDGLKFTPSTGSSADNAGAGAAAATTAAAASTSAASSGSTSSSSQASKSFVTEACTADSDCQQGCCAFLTGKCAGPDVAQTNGDGGCGFKNTSPNCDVAAALGLNACVAGAATPDTTSAEVQAAAAFVAQLDNLKFTPATGADNAGSGAAAATTAAAAAATTAASSSSSSSSLSQSAKSFVTEACTADSDCQQGCCAFLTGKCAGPDVAQTNGDGGCGFKNTSPNCDVAAALGLDACVAGAATPDTTSAEVQAAAAFVAQLDNLKFTPTRRAGGGRGWARGAAF